MRLITPPGVFSPISDTWLLAAVLSEAVDARCSVLDVCTGSGALAVCAARCGARSVTAVDVSRRAVLTARLNGWLNGVRVHARRSDLFAELGEARFDVIVSNPPYVPSETDEAPGRGPQRAWDAGRDGRLVLDRLLSEAPARLRRGGVLLVVHSEVCGIPHSLEAMQRAGLQAEVATRRQGPLGPLMRSRVRHLEDNGLLPRGRREETVAVLQGRAPV
jgi:release factor glutamine methyltransferase